MIVRLQDGETLSFVMGSMGLIETKDMQRIEGSDGAVSYQLGNCGACPKQWGIDAQGILCEGGVR